MNNSELKTTESKIRRLRRTDIEIKKSIFDAISQIIKEKGFTVLSVNLIAEYSKVSPIVINKRFKGLNDIIQQFTSRWDYWIDIFNENSQQSPTKESYKETLESVLDTIWKKKTIQQILAWQTTEDSWLLDSIVEEQEDAIKAFNKKFATTFNETFDIRIITAILLAAIYYISAYKKKKSFCGLNMKGNFGNLKLLEGINQISDLVFNHAMKTKEKDIAKKLLESGDSIEKVMLVTGLNKEEINSL